MFTWKLLHSCSISLGCSSHICGCQKHLLYTADTKMEGHYFHWLQGHSLHWRNLPKLITKTHISRASYIQSVYVCVGYCTYPTSWEIAAHHRHVALICEVSQRHIPACCSAFTGVTASFAFQVVDVDARSFLYHSNCIVGCTGTWGKYRTGVSTQ